MDIKEIGQRIHGRRDDLGFTLDDVATKVGVHKSTIQRYEIGDIKSPKLPVIQAIAKALGVDPDWIIGKSASRCVDSNILPVPDMKRIPVYGTIPAGTPALAIEHIEGYDFADVSNAEDYFFLRVKGDSMINANIFDGSLVLIHRQSCADNGQIVACLVNGDEATLKRFKQQNSTIVLIPENPAYEPRILSTKDFDDGYAMILGVAIEVKTKL